MNLQMDLNIIAKNLNDDCLSHIYSFVNTRQICFKMLKQKHDTIITNHILRPTIKRFTEGKYYTKHSSLGFFVFRVDSLTKCFITFTYNDDFITDGVLFPLSKRKLKRRYDKDDYEYFESEERPRIRYEDAHTKYLVELDKPPILCYSLWNEFNWSRKMFRNDEYNYLWAQKADKLMLDINEMNGDFDWLLIDLRKKKIVEYEDKVATAIQEAETRGRWARQYDFGKEIGKLNDLNRLQIALYRQPLQASQSDIEYILQSETK